MKRSVFDDEFKKMVLSFYLEIAVNINVSGHAGLLLEWSSTCLIFIGEKKTR